MESIQVQFNNININNEETYNEQMSFIEQMLVQHADNIPIRNQINTYISHNIEHFKIAAIAENNWWHILEVCLLCENFEYHEIYDDTVFFDIFQELIVDYGDKVDIFRVLHQYWVAHPPESTIDYPPELENSYTFKINFKLVFETALVKGYEGLMHYALNNSNECDYEILNEEYSVYKFDDTITYAIIGKNINCVRHLLDRYAFLIEPTNWSHYVEFAAIHGTKEIILYLLTLKPFIVEQIEDFYNKMLQYSLCGTKMDIVQWALENGAQISPVMFNFVKEFIRNEYIGNNDSVCNDDNAGYYSMKYHRPHDFEESLKNCMRIIQNH